MRNYCVSLDEHHLIDGLTFHFDEICSKLLSNTLKKGLY